MNIDLYLQIMNSVKEINEETVAAKGGGVIFMAYLKADTQDKLENVKSVALKPKT